MLIVCLPNYNVRKVKIFICLISDVSQAPRIMPNSIRYLLNDLKKISNRKKKML